MLKQMFSDQNDLGDSSQSPHPHLYSKIQMSDSKMLWEPGIKDVCRSTHPKLVFPGALDLKRRTL